MSYISDYLNTRRAGWPDDGDMPLIVLAIMDSWRKSMELQNNDTLMKTR